jgi:hypothetical protein
MWHNDCDCDTTHHIEQQLQPQYYTQHKNGDHDTHAAQQLQLRHHMQHKNHDSNGDTTHSTMTTTATPPQHEDSTHETMHGAMTAATTPTQHNDSTCYTMHGTTTATTTPNVALRLQPQLRPWDPVGIVVAITLALIYLWALQSPHKPSHLHRPLPALSISKKEPGYNCLIMPCYALLAQ